MTAHLYLHLPIVVLHPHRLNIRFKIDTNSLRASSRGIQDVTTVSTCTMMERNYCI
jgi:hypothetical protein